MELEVLERLGGWSGFKVTRVERQAGSPAQIRIRLEPVDAGPLRCGECGALSTHVHERIVREVRDLPLLDAQTILEVTVLRVDLRPNLKANRTVSSHGNFDRGELTDEEAVYRRADRPHPA